MTAASPQGPDQLNELAELYLQLPPRSIRWETVPGREFLLALKRLEARYTAKACAAALGVSTSAVYKMLDRQLLSPAQPKPWPSREEIRPLASAWRRARALGRPAHPSSPEYARVHQVLARLLGSYEITVLARALQVGTRDLDRYTQPPLSPEQIARQVGRHLRGRP